MVAGLVFGDVETDVTSPIALEGKDVAKASLRRLHAKLGPVQSPKWFPDNFGGRTGTKDHDCCEEPAPRDVVIRIPGDFHPGEVEFITPADDRRV
jgi:hypothetical protein